jgi:TusA-related sulfurtransferase
MFPARLACCFALFAAVSSIGCDEKKKTEATPAPSATTTTAAVADAAAATATDAAAATGAATATGDAGKQDAHMANCPSAAPGATVALKDVEGGVEITITGKDEAAGKDIKARMVKLVESHKNEADAGVKHDHAGGGGGAYGRCTIVMRNTKLETADIANGVKATVKANNKTEVDWLRRETRERDTEAKLPAAEGAGTHKMAHCPSAVEGAKTVVKDAKEGVIVTITAPANAADKLKDIRDRAKHTADVAKMTEPPKVEHNAEGKGGGGLGRCPVVVEGDTTVEVKDIDNGVEINVKAKKDVGALQKEAKLRAGNFGAK